MNYYLNNQKWQPVNWSSVIHDDDHLATSTLTVIKMIDFLKWFYAGGHAAVSVKQQADSEWGGLGEAEEVYWGLWSRRLITTAAAATAHYSLNLKLCGKIFSQSFDSTCGQSDLKFTTDAWSSQFLLLKYYIWEVLLYSWSYCYRLEGKMWCYTCNIIWNIAEGHTLQFREDLEYFLNLTTMPIN